MVAVRNAKMLSIIEEMQAMGKLHLEPINWDEAGKMHGHMIDF